jgi:hypothetical protein
MFTCVVSHLIGLQVGCSGTVVETLTYGEFPCCLVGGRLDSVGAVVCLAHRQFMLAALARLTLKNEIKMFLLWFTGPQHTERTSDKMTCLLHPTA